MGVIENHFHLLRVDVEQHERSYDFTPYSEIGEAFVAAFANQFHLKIARGGWSRASTISYFYILGNLLTYIRDNVGPESKFRRSLQHNYTAAARKDWQEVLRQWRSQVAERADISRRRKENFIAGVRPFIWALSNAGVIPQLGDVLLGFEFDSSPKRSLAQMTNNAMTESELSIRLRKINKDVTAEEIPGAIDYFKALASESEISQLNNESIPNQVLMLLDVRLAELRRCAEADLVTEFSKVETGRSLVAQSDLSGRELSARVDFCESPVEIRRLFPAGDTGLARLLAYYMAEYGGVRHHYYDSTSDGRNIGRWFYEAEQAHGGSRSVSSHLSASRRLLTAAQVILLHDTAMNVESCRTLRRDCVGPPRGGVQKLNWLKRRARGYENQYEFLPVNDGVNKVSAVKTVEMVRTATEVLASNAEHAGPHDTFLFLSADGSTRNSNLGNRIRLAVNATFLKNFKAFLSDHERLAGLAHSMTQDAIRPSLLLREALRTRSIAAVRKLGKHRSTTTSFKYVHRLPMQIAGNASIQLFMQSLQVLATQGIEGICQKAGISVEKYEALKSELVETGLGVYCTDPLAGVQKNEGYGKGVMCGAVDKCLTCQNVSRYVFATAENVAHLLMWRRHLLGERERMLSERPERWVDVWEPWLVFIDVALEKLQAGQFKKTYSEAEVLAETRESVFPELW